MDKSIIIPSYFYHDKIFSVKKPVNYHVHIKVQIISLIPVKTASIIVTSEFTGTNA